MLNFGRDSELLKNSDTGPTIKDAKHTEVTTTVNVRYDI
jgi:hypothetical protein